MPARALPCRRRRSRACVGALRIGYAAALVSSWLVPLATLAKKRGDPDARAIGGKAARLVWLERHDFPVPDAWVLSTEAFIAALKELPPGCDPKSLLRAAGGKSGEARAAEAREILLRAPLPRGLGAELSELWRAQSPRLPWGLAVRSSATCEDGLLLSMAGLAETKLGVTCDDALVDAIRAVWASVASGRALAYLAAHGVKDVGMAVILQRMVPATAAGVMFTQAPDRPRWARERVINATFGLGVSVASGEMTPDVLRVDEKGRVVESILAHKERRLRVHDGKVAADEVAHPDASALPPAVILSLAETALRLEKLEDIAHDVEFACEEDKTWIVQVRPATGSGYPTGGDATTVWSNANVGEALPGVATPLTWSVAGTFSETGFRRAFATLGCRVPKSAVLVASVHGRFYLNLSEFMRIASQVPWLEARTFVELAGGAGNEELTAQARDVSHRGFYARLPLTATRLVKEQLRLDDDIHRFEAWAERALKQHHALDLAILPDEGLARTILDAQAMLERTGNVMLTCASSTLGAHLVLKELLMRVAPIGADRLAQSLTSGVRDLESARPAIGLMRVAALAQAEPLVRAALDRMGDGPLVSAGLDAIPDGPTRRALVAYLDLYGDRAVREPELSTPRWREDPRPVLTMLRVTLRGEARDPERAFATARALADSEMQRILPRLNVIEQTALRHLVSRAQKASRLRERMRNWVTRVLGWMRQIFLDAERRLLRLMPELADDERELAAHGSNVAHVPAVFFLSVDELLSTLRNARTDMVPLLRARRAEYARDLARPEPPTTFVGAPRSVLIPPSGGELLRGLAASSGIVEGRARVLRSEAEMGLLQPGEILVVHATDVGWTPLFMVAAGVVTELGGALSHAAIVARELGVPSVVNVASATLALDTGDRLRVDGDRGVVERLVARDADDGSARSAKTS
ncbi:phosphoenolpyruvate synthase [soil metagenome]